MFGTKSEDRKYEDESSCLPTRKHNKRKFATNLVTSTRVSTNKSAKVYKQFWWFDIPTKIKQQFICQLSKGFQKNWRKKWLKNFMMEQCQRWNYCCKNNQKSWWIQLMLCNKDDNCWDSLRKKSIFCWFTFRKFLTSSLRWNSRTILAILAFGLMPSTRKSLKKVCRFVSYNSTSYWFTNKKNFKNLLEILKPKSMLSL